MADDFDPQHNISTFWSSYAPEYDRAVGHGLHTEEDSQIWLNTLRDLLPPAPADVVDLGCGTGFLAFLIAELGHRVTGYDLSEGMLRQAGLKAERTPPPPRFELGDAVEPPVDDASVDAISPRLADWVRRPAPSARPRWNATSGTTHPMSKPDCR